MAAQRARIPLLLALLAAVAWGSLTPPTPWSSGSFAVVGAGSRAGARHAAAGPARRGSECRGGSAGRLGAARTLAGARGGETAEADSIELGGFAGFVVGLALLPHVVNALVVAFGVTVGGDSFAPGPFGLEFVSIATTLGLVAWSLGSFVERGRGLPAGPLGLLGLSEGLSYLAALGLVIAALASSSRGGDTPTPSGASAPQLSAPKLSAPSFSAPSFKAPEFKAPDFKVPEFKAPDFKVPEFKVPDVKVPDFKVPDVKMPEFKAPDIKIPEVKLPEPKVAEKKSEVKAPEVKAPAVKEPEVKVPETKAPVAKAPKITESMPNYDSLFD